MFGRRAADNIGGRPRVREYLSALMASFSSPYAPAKAELAADADLPERVFDVLTNREFCYLSKTRVAAYRGDILRLVANATTQGTPIDFYYDIGGGYHATLRPGVEDVSFTVGIAEIFMLRQIRRFANRIAAFYPAGVRFHLVIDNLCAHLINDIPVERTLSYCGALRELIRQTSMHEIVDLLVESEHTSVPDFERVRATLGADAAGIEVTLQQHRNVERFLGRLCGEEEALARCVRYREVTTASERLLEPFIRGVHMTQRATPGTLCFRPFPGGDSRIQSGEVGLRSASGPQLGPILLTSANVGEYMCYRDRPADVLPGVVPHVTYAVPL
ncbi:MAG TPA: hypothetical protein VKB34_16850 [Povalibacter sp.]|nr:hypothetical protein [Povalibacter sp.]